MAAVRSDKADPQPAPPGKLSPARFITNAAEAPALPGAYLLLVTLPAPLLIALPGRPEATLHPGLYLYAGSARGPGGLRARLARHLRADKTPHWHIDRVTLAGTARGAWIFPGGDECVLIAALEHLPVPLPGFGSTDCRHCASHLLAWPAGKPAKTRRTLTPPA
jgi:Uri superfamily endonuclease